MTPRILHIDIETSPNLCYTWGLFKQNISIGQIAQPGATLCFAAKWEGDRTMHFHSSWNDGLGMLGAAWELLDEADIVVHYNGAKFDIPTLNKEFALNGMSPPSPYRQVDLLPVVRKQFRFVSNKLDFVAQQLGLGSKTQHKGFSLWTGTMEGNLSSQRTMERYNKQDVRLLEKLYKKLTPWLVRSPNMGVYVGADRAACTKCGSTDIQYRGTVSLQAGTYRRFVCKSCGGWSRDAANLLDRDSRKALARPVVL